MQGLHGDAFANLYDQAASDSSRHAAPEPYVASGTILQGSCNVDKRLPGTRKVSAIVSATDKDPDLISIHSGQSHRR